MSRRRRGHQEEGEIRIILEGASRVRLDLSGEDLEVSSENLEPVSPYHLLAASLASCTALTIASWATGAGIETDRLVVSVGWEMSEARPKRITRMRMEVVWPGLPTERLAAAHRAADLCPIHATLRLGTEIAREITPTA